MDHPSSAFMEFFSQDCIRNRRVTINCLNLQVLDLGIPSSHTDNSTMFCLVTVINSHYSLFFIRKPA